MLPHWTETDVDGIHVYRTGMNTGKPQMVLQHGFSDNGLCWAPVARELEGEYEIVMPDARGHGKSARVERGQHIDQVEELAATMRALGIEQAIVGGHSMGAGMAAGLAARFPELVRALVLEDPPWFPIPADTLRPGRYFTEDSPMGTWLRGMQAKSLDEAVAQNHAEHPVWPEMYLRPWTEAKQQIDLNFLASDNVGAGPWPEVAKAIRCPALLVSADPEQGGIITPEVAEAVCGANPYIRVVNFRGVGHHVRFAVHEEYMKALRQFLKEVS
jgi:N-formylmaleamate deformylase